MTTKHRKRIILLAGMPVITAILALGVIAVISRMNARVKETEIVKEAAYSFDHDFNAAETSSDIIYFARGFIYFTPWEGGLYEYDQSSGTVLEISGNVSDSVLTQGISIYQGKIFTNSWSVGGEHSPSRFSLIDPDLHTVKVIKELPAEYEADRAVISSNGNVFYLRDPFRDNGEKRHLNDEGYLSDSELIRCDIENDTEEKLADDVYGYLIDGDNIYFHKMTPSFGLHLYYTTFDDARAGIAPVDTGIDVGEYYGSCMWTVKDGLVYYCNAESGELRSYDPISGRQETVYSTDKGIAKFAFWHGKIVFFCYNKENKDYRSEIIIYDPVTDKTVSVCRGVLKTDADYDPIKSENIASFAASESLDFIVVEVHQCEGGTASRFYKYYEDGRRELISEISWNYYLDDRGTPISEEEYNELQRIKQIEAEQEKEQEERKTEAD